MASRALVGPAVLAALALTSLASATSAPSSSHRSTTLVSAAANRCSKSTALSVATQLRIVPDPTLPSPISKVLCGAFTGPGSQAMVAVFARGTCLPSSGWAVFRLTRGTWQLVVQRTGFSTLAAAGPDIKETVAVWRRGDPPCNPGGGTKSRLWHWNGSRLLAGAWQKTVHLYYFVSPSRNISCGVGDEDVAHCASRSRPHSATLRPNGTVTICRGARCVGDRSSPPAYPVLRYGETDVQEPFRCRSELVGITCTVSPSGKGFFINRDGVSRVGP